MNLKKEEFAGQQEWNRNFSFLKNAGLDTPYLTILALARSKRELRALHNVLPRNCRLLRNDLINLENFWAKYFYFGLTSKKSAGKLPYECLKWILKNQCPKDNQTFVYYLHKLQEKSLARTYMYTKYRILSCSHRSGSGDYHFNISISNADFGMGCFLSEDRTALSVKVLSNASFLDEELAHNIIEWPPYQIESGEGPNGIVFTWHLDASDFLPFVKERREKYGNRLSDFIIEDGFLSLLLKRLKDHGLPITSQKIESVVRHRGELEEDESLKEEDTQVRVSPIKREN